MELLESKLYKNICSNSTGTVVYNKKLNKYYTLYMNNSGYMYAAGIPVHRIVASAYKFDSYFEGATVDHIDSNKINNDITNLEWVSQSENEYRSYKNGRKGAWADKTKIYPKERRIKQGNKIRGKNNLSAKCRILVCDNGEKRICYTRKELIDAIYEIYGVNYSLSYIKCLLKAKRDNKLKFSIFEGQSTIETTDANQIKE